MRTLLVGLTSLFAAATTTAADEFKPLLVVTVHSIWHPLHGKESPQFALYDDGTVICRPRESEANGPYQRLKVDDPLAARTEILGPAFAQADASYDVTLGTDFPTTVFWTPEKIVSVYGLAWRPLQTYEDPQWHNPAGLHDAMLRICSWSDRPGAPWLPDYIEVWFRDRPFRPSPLPSWPDGWPQPDLQTPTDPARGWCSVLLPAGHLQELRQLLPRSFVRSAYLRVGESVCETAYRISFPGESAWRSFQARY